MDIDAFSLPIYVSIVLSDGLNLNVLKSNGYFSLFGLFMGSPNNTLELKTGFNWKGIYNSTIKGLIQEILIKYICLEKNFCLRYFRRSQNF